MKQTDIFRPDPILRCISKDLPIVRYPFLSENRRAERIAVKLKIGPERRTPKDSFAHHDGFVLQQVHIRSLCERFQFRNKPRHYLGIVIVIPQAIDHW